MLTRLSCALLTAFLIPVMLSSCRETTPSDTLAITNRSVKDEPYKLMMLKFKTPALLSTVEHDKNKLLINESQKTQLLKEQIEYENFLHTLSRDIKILSRYRFVLNGFAILIPTRLISHLKDDINISEIHSSENFLRPDAQKTPTPAPKVGEHTSVNFIGADRVQKELHYEGKGIRVGVIDTGIDYTHAMFGGKGTEEAYKAVDPAKKTSDFPNNKVVGGIDLVGSDYDDASFDFNRRVPVPDENPIDESGHGTHVAGTIAGIGDGINTYTGVAPGAQLYAIKVFGKEGSTSDFVVIAALEYAVNPSGNLDPNDHLDVVNLSLGSQFGVPYRLYDEAMKNLVKADVIPVISAGNAGNVPYIVGAPSSIDEALSVAASIDNMDQNWKFRGVKFKNSKDIFLIRAIEASFAKPLESVGDLHGKLVYIGLANEDLDEKQKNAVRGNVALIDRGGSPFTDKITRAVNAGAIGVVFANNIDGEATSMGGSGNFDIPVIMISKSYGTRFKDAMTDGEEFQVQFNTDQRIEDPTLIDTLTNFSSRGPRSLDSAIKPEISAPGSNILSAKVGGGKLATAMSGTSMAAPHIAGCVALLKEMHPDWNYEQIKSVLMSNSVNIKDNGNNEYPVSRQGAGRVDIFNAVKSKGLSVHPAAISLGDMEVSQKKDYNKTLSLQNASKEAMSVYFTTRVPEELEIEFPNSVLVPANSKVEVPYTVFVKAPTDKQVKELSAFIYVKSEEGEILAKIATLGVVKKLSLLRTESLKVHASCKEDAESSLAELTLKNEGTDKAQAYIFNHLASNSRKPPVGTDRRLTDICDLESVGYRTVEKTVNSKKEKFLQFAAKLHSPLTNWEHCELSIQIDGNGDGIPDQELVAASLFTLNPAASYDTYKTVLTDAKEMRRLRKEVDNGEKANYTKAIVDTQDLKTFDHSTLMIMNVPLSKIHQRPFGLMKVKIAALASAEPFSSPDHFLGSDANAWLTIDPFERASPYYGMPEEVEVPAMGTVKVPLTHGESTGNMIVYYPYNKSSKTFAKDSQSEIIHEEFLY